MDHPHEPDRLEWKIVSLIFAGGLALLGGLILSALEDAPTYVPLGGAALLVLCYCAAGFLFYRHAQAG
ncbi:hypothetical protein [Methylobacterium sp. CM6257]